MPHSLKVFLCLPPLMLALDYIWLSLLASGLYRSELGGLMRLSGGGLQPIIWAAALVYLALAAGIVLFVLPRAGQGASLGSVLLWGAAFGLVVYTVYDMTNHSLLKDWPLRISLVDIAWGGLLNALGTLAAVHLDRWFK